jgi:hypothetical protein
MIERYPGGREKLDETIQGGELFQTIVYNPVSHTIAAVKMPCKVYMKQRPLYAILYGVAPSVTRRFVHCIQSVFENCLAGGIYCR